MTRPQGVPYKTYGSRRVPLNWGSVFERITVSKINRPRERSRDRLARSDNHVQPWSAARALGIRSERDAVCLPIYETDCMKVFVRHEKLDHFPDVGSQADFPFPILTGRVIWGFVNNHD